MDYDADAGDAGAERSGVLETGSPAWTADRDTSRGRPAGETGSAAGSRRRTHVLLYLATCLSTFWAYGAPDGQLHIELMYRALIYSAGIMCILTAHELGHFFQARRNRVPASLPYFIPMPLPPIGTMGAVIAMRGAVAGRKALFDIAVSGPLAGLVPTVLFSAVGLYWSEMIPARGQLGDPLLFQILVKLFFGPLEPGYDILLHPLAYAGWVGLLLTAVNLMPIGQLDGGHVLYAMLGKRANTIAQIVLYSLIVAMVLTKAWMWILMLLLLTIVGPKHPPTANDSEPLGAGRLILGCVAFAFLVLGFTPRPFIQ